MAHMPNDDLKHRLDRGLFFRPDAAALAIAEKADREFGTAVGQVLARIQTEIHERGLTGTIRRRATSKPISSHIADRAPMAASCRRSAYPRK